jgi:hypothetical protein
MSFKEAVIVRFVFAFITIIPLDGNCGVLKFLMILHIRIPVRCKLTFITMKPVFSFESGVFIVYVFL